MKLGHRKTLCLDFDGVIHSYASGWKGARNIPDPPVPGAFEFILQALQAFDVAIYSSRSHQWGGRRAMKRWLRREFTRWLLRGSGTKRADEANQRFCNAADVLKCWPLEGSRAEDCDALAYHLVRRIQWPNHKPAAHYSIDDRAAQFGGDWSVFDIEGIMDFKPWNKRGEV